jgi:hypothetical protein
MQYIVEFKGPKGWEIAGEAATPKEALKWATEIAKAERWDTRVTIEHVEGAA